MKASLIGILIASAGFLVSGCGSVEANPDKALASRCAPPPVHYTPYPGGDERLSGIPWIRGAPSSAGIVALLWYWPEEWRRQRLREARIFAGGKAPAGYNTKVLWAFLAESAKGRGGGTLVVQGRRLDGQGTFRQEFAAIAYEGQEGAPSYASLIDVPEPGCWRLQLSTGELQAHVDLLAVRGT